eukprot:gene4586-6776_t
MGDLDNSACGQGMVLFIAEMGAVVSKDADNYKSRMADNTEQSSEGVIFRAVTLLRDAQHSSQSFLLDDPGHFHSYLLYHNFWLKFAIRIITIIHLALPLFEEPNGNLRMELYPPITLSIEVFCISATFIDMMVYTFCNFTTARWTRLCRPILMCTLSDFRQIRRSFRALRRTLKNALGVFLLLLLTIAFFSLVFLKLFTSRDLLNKHGDQYMSSYFEIYYELYVLATTANFPDIMMPAYAEQRGYVVIFVIFLILTTYILVSVLLAVVYNNYKRHLEAEVKCQISTELETMTRCYQLLADPSSGHVSHKDWVTVVSLSQHMEKDKAILLWEALVGDCNTVGKHIFLKTIDILDLDIRLKTHGSNFFDLYFPTVYHSRISQLLKGAVEHEYFSLFFDILIIVNAIFAGLAIDEAEVVFLILYNLELLLKLYTFSGKRFFSKHWNKFDFVIIISGTLLRISGGAPQNLIDAVLILRLLRIIKAIRRIPRFKIIVSTLAHIGPALSTYGAMIFGNHSLNGSLFSPTSPFAKDIIAGNPSLSNTTFAQSLYFQNNFNDIVSSFVVLFELMTVNQWHVLAGGFVAVTSKAARIFFMTFHIITVLVMVNIFIAFILEAFLLQLQLVSQENDDAFMAHVRWFLQNNRAPSGRFYKLKASPKSTDAIYRRLFKDIRSVLSSREQACQQNKIPYAVDSQVGMSSTLCADSQLNSESTL